MTFQCDICKEFKRAEYLITFARNSSLDYYNRDYKEFKVCKDCFNRFKSLIKRGTLL